MKAKLIKVGNSKGLLLTAQTVKELGLSVGDEAPFKILPKKYKLKDLVAECKQ